MTVRRIYGQYVLLTESNRLTALKTLTLRLRGSKTELEEMGEDVSDMATTTSQLQAKLLALTGGQVDIMADANTFKNSTQILREMADAWEDMNDIQRASALELMGGKRQANVLSALIQNFDTVEKVIETSANSAGSALKENERYLDSIQGKIDQFNNAVQSLWQNLLGSDVIKGMVEWGTKIVKSLDTTKGKILAIVKAAALLMAYKKVNPLDWITKFADITSAIKTDGLKNYIMSLFQVSAAQKTVTADTLVGTIAQEQNNVATQQQIISKMGLTNVTGALTAAQKLQAAQELVTLYNGGLISRDLAMRMAGMLGYKFSVDAANTATVTLDTTTKSFMATNPIGWILLIISALAAVVMWLSQISSKTEKLTEELKDLQSELRDIRSELESVNSELETTNERMAELLAKDSLSFIEEEELKALQKHNEELQREIDLLELKEKQTKKDTADKFIETMDADVNTNDGWNNEYKKDAGKIRKIKWYDWVFDFSETFVPTFSKASEDEYIEQQVTRYQELQSEIVAKEKEIFETDGTDKKSKKKRTKLENEKKKLEDEASDIEGYINDKTTEWSELSADLDYGINDETDAWLDYINNVQDKWAITSGGTNAKTNALNRIFNKNENAAISESIDDYVKALKNGDMSAKVSIENIIKNNEALVEDIKASGLSVEDAVDYFASFVSNANYATIEGKVKEMEEATKRLNVAFGSFDTSSADAVKQALADKGWVDVNGELMSDAIAEYFGGEGGGISSETQAEIERLVKQIYDGKISVENALKEFEHFGIESTLDIYIAEVQTNFKDVFVELEDADGLIDTFKELGEAIGSTADALKMFNKAEAEMANSGRVSIETALQLMEYTDDYGSVLEVVDGKLQLVDGAEEALIQTRINAIKTSAEASLADALAAEKSASLAVQKYQEALQTDVSASVIAKSWEKVLAAGAGLLEGIKSLLTDESWTDAYNRGYNDTLSQITGYETTYDDAGLQTLVDAQNKAKDTVKAAQDRVNLANQLTSETLESINDADDVDTTDDVRDDRFQKEMEYWENRIGAEQSRYQQIQNEIDLLEAKGKTAGSAYYKSQIKSEEQRRRLLVLQQNAVSQYMKELDEGSEAWWEAANTFNDLENEIDGATLSIQELNNAILDNADGLVDDIQSIYDTLADAEKEYAENGFISVDTLQSLLELEPKYLDMLVNQNGDLALNEEALQEVTKARIEDMVIKQQSAFLDEMLELATNGTTAALIDQIAIMEVATETQANWTEERLRAIRTEIMTRDDLSDAEKNAFMQSITNQVNAYKRLGELSYASLGQEEADNSYQALMDRYENQISAQKAKYDQVQNEIDLLEKKGQKAGASYYEEQIKLEEHRLALLEAQKFDATSRLRDLEEGSEAWWDVANTLNDIEGEIDDVAASIVDLQDAIGEIDTYKLEEFNNRLDNLTSKLGTIRDLIAPDGEEDWFDEEGNWTEEGVAVLGSYVQELEIYKNGLTEVAKAREKYAKSYAGNEEYYEKLGIHSEQELYDKQEELISQQYDYAKAVNDTEKSVVDMYESNIDAIEEYTQTLVDGYNDYIDSVKDALSAERDLYDFKKNVQKQAKDIAAIERRISSLSGSTNAADIAERRKLEAELYESRESLNDTYYDHAKESQNEALDSEAKAYEDTMTKFIDGLHTSLEEATENMDEFLMGVTSMVMYNADTVLEKYEETNLPLTKELTNPWEEAKKAAGDYSGDALDLMNQWTREGGFFSQFNTTGTTNLTSPWDEGTNAANLFQSNISNVMAAVVDNIASNVETSKNDLSSLYADITSTMQYVDSTKKYAADTVSEIQKMVDDATSNVDDLTTNIKDSDGQPNSTESPTNLKPLLPAQPSKLGMIAYGKNSSTIRIGSMALVNQKKEKINGIDYIKATDGFYYPASKLQVVVKRDPSQGGDIYGFPAGTTNYKKQTGGSTGKYQQVLMNAKGTLGTKRDGWNITDESWIGEEITLAAGKNGQLQYLKKGSAVMPADISANLVEWGKINPDMLNAGVTPNINMINNAVNKPELNVTFDSLVRAENITEETLPAVKKLVTQELNRFTRELNYALKGKGAR